MDAALHRLWGLCGGLPHRLSCDGRDATVVAAPARLRVVHGLRTVCAHLRSDFKPLSIMPESEGVERGGDWLSREARRGSATRNGLSVSIGRSSAGREGNRGDTSQVARNAGGPARTTRSPLTRGARSERRRGPEPVLAAAHSGRERSIGQERPLCVKLEASLGHHRNAGRC